MTFCPKENCQKYVNDPKSKNGCLFYTPCFNPFFDEIAEYIRLRFEMWLTGVR